MLIPFGEWKPDSSFFGADTLKQAKNVYASSNSYAPLKKLINFSEPLENDALGSASFVDRNGVIVTVAGDSNKLYVSRGYKWEDISRPEGYNSTGQVWRFVMWGDYILATNYNDPIQAWRIGDVGTFLDMSTTAPRCKDMNIVNEFLVLVNTFDTLDNERPNRVWWSPIGDPFGVWESSPTTLCDYQDINVGSYCVGVKGGSYGIVLMRNAIIRMNFIGSPLAFSIETVETDRGCVGLQAFTTDDDDIYYVAQDGFYYFNGSNSVSLGAGKIDKWFFDNSEIVSSDLIIASFDIIKRAVFFGYPSKGEYEKINKLLIYGILGQRWTQADNTFKNFTQFLSKGYDLEELDDISTDVDALPFPLDSNYYKGGVPSLGGFGLDNKLYFEGEEDQQGLITTGDIALIDNLSRAYTQRVRLLAEGGEGHIMQISGKQALNEPDNFIRRCTLTRLGDFSERKAGRYHSFHFEINGNWEKAQSFDVMFTQEGTQ